MARPWEFEAHVAKHPVVAAVRDHVNGVLSPSAAAIDGSQVDRQRVAELARLGVLSLHSPVGLGGLDAPRPVRRAVEELVNGACGATGFVIAQHTRPAVALARAWETGHCSDFVHEAAGRVATGEWLASTAITHLRRPGLPQVTAVERGGRWVLDGRVDWLTGWGIADVVLIGATAPDDQVLLVVVRATDGGGLAASAPMRLLAMSATGTVTLTLTGFEIPADAIVALVPGPVWRVADESGACDARPAAFGLLATVIDRLSDALPAGSAAAHRVDDAASRARDIRSQSYALADGPDGADTRALRLDLRARQLDLLTQLATSLVVAGGGRATVKGCNGERLVREALFHLVSGQTGEVRAATLGAVLGPDATAGRTSQSR